MSISIRRQGATRSLQPQGARGSVEAARPMQSAWPETHDDPIHGRIQARAYQIYLDRTRRGETGDAEGDWYQAQRELNGKIAAPGAPAEIMVKAHEMPANPARSE